MSSTDRIIIFCSIMAVCIVGIVAYRWSMAPIASLATPEEEIQVRNEPIQNEVKGIYLPVMGFGKKRVFLDAKASYSLSGVLVSKRKYHSGFMSDLSPYDYAVVWGDVPDMLKYLKFDQVVRFCLYEYKEGAPIDPNYVSTHMSNNHMIPSNKNIRRALGKARKGSEVKIDGYLVYVEAASMGGGTSKWLSSLNRFDTGNGACEIIYVTQLQIDNRIYR